LDESSLLSGGKHYDFLVDWSKRLSTEIPFIIDLIGEITPKIKSILIAGCGTGHHAQVLHEKYNFEITGVDIEESMIEEARQRVPNAELIVQDFLDPELLNGRTFDAIVSVGNSVGLMASNSNFEEIINTFSRLLRKSNGILLFQILNTEKEREGWSIPRSVVTDEGEFVFLRRFSTSKEFVHPEIITFFKQKNGEFWQNVSTGGGKIPRISQISMISLLQEKGFQNIRVYGNYQKKPFKSSSSTDMIFVAFTN
jgi:ubiquinone/menaquinone biosynthesis C-methylase UbiE